MQQASLSLDWRIPIHCPESQTGTSTCQAHLPQWMLPDMLVPMDDSDNIKTLGVFCGSSVGRGDRYRQGASALAQEMIKQNISLVYGGGGRGLMGQIASSVYGHVPRVTGVIPEKLYEMVKQIEHHEDELIIVSGMHERKAAMYRLADAFVALPGGVGTIEEIMEVFTWLHLGYHHKPVALFNVAGFYDKLVGFLRYTVDEGFLKQAFLDSLIVEADPGCLIERLRHADTRLPGKLD